MTKHILIAIPLFNNPRFITESLPSLYGFTDTDILIIDDGSDEDLFALVDAQPGVRCVRHERFIGSGTSFITGYQYARDFTYDFLIMINPDNPCFKEDIEAISENLGYGYDVVTCSRILENFDYEEIPKELIEITERIAAALAEATDFNVTDPLSGIIGVRMEAARRMDFTEFSHAVHLQLLIQASYFGLNVLEIPSHSGKSFGEEFGEYEDPLGFFLSRIESEKYLYKKGTMN